jgi:hypothetical protein
LVAVLAHGEEVGLEGGLDPGVSVVTWSGSWPPPGSAVDRAAGAVLVEHVARTLAYACRKSDGVHWNDDHFLVEVVDPASGAPRPAGEAGALLVTDLAREGSPLLRFWTGLEASLVEDACACGRTSARSPLVRPLD